MEDDGSARGGDSTRHDSDYDDVARCSARLAVLHPVHHFPTEPHQGRQAGQERRLLVARIAIECNVDKVNGVPPHERVQIRRDWVRERRHFGVPRRQQQVREDEESRRREPQQHAGDYDPRDRSLLDCLLPPIEHVHVAGPRERSVSERVDLYSQVSLIITLLSSPSEGCGPRVHITECREEYVLERECKCA